MKPSVVVVSFLRSKVYYDLPELIIESRLKKN